MWEFIGWIIIGGLAGWIASKIMGTDAQQGILGNIIVGVIGALIGGFVLFFIELGDAGFIVRLLTATVGAVILIWLLRLVTGRRA